MDSSFSSRIFRILALSGAICVAYAMSFPAGARAIDYPFTKKSAADAIAWGKSVDMESFMNDSRYNFTADIPTWPGYTPTCEIFSNYYMVAFAAAEDIKKYSNDTPESVREAMSDHMLRVSFKNFSTSLTANDGAGGVIHQGSLVVRASTKKLDEPDVTSLPGTDAGYMQEIEFKFDLRKFNPSKPFTVALANVAVLSPGGQSAVTGETACSITPDTR